MPDLAATIGMDETRGLALGRSALLLFGGAGVAVPFLPKGGVAKCRGSIFGRLEVRVGLAHEAIGDESRALCACGLCTGRGGTDRCGAARILSIERRGASESDWVGSGLGGTNDRRVVVAASS
jgi:hypothetical protein